MFLRVVLTTFIVYQAVSASQGELEIYNGNPAVDYFWTTLRQTLQHFIDVWNSNDRKNVVSRETLQEIWYPLERSIKDEIGSKSWMLINNHIKETLTHPQAAYTLETLFSRIHNLFLRDAYNEFRDLYKGLANRTEAWKNLRDLKVLFFDRAFKIYDDDKLRKKLEIIKNYYIGREKNLKGESSKQDGPSENTPKEEKHGRHLRRSNTSGKL